MAFNRKPYFLPHSLNVYGLWYMYTNFVVIFFAVGGGGREEGWHVNCNDLLYHTVLAKLRLIPIVSLDKIAEHVCVEGTA